MRRSVTTALSVATTAGRAQHAFMLAAARVPGLDVVDRFDARLSGVPVTVVPVPSRHHGVIHLVDLPADTPDGGDLSVLYTAEVIGDPAAAAEAAESEVTAGELLEYLRPSRYAESDRLAAIARSELGTMEGFALARAVTDWVRQRLAYVPGASRHTDGAVETILARTGVCRDFAHVVVALLRALDVPSRIASVYAPGLSPMDFHAVAEAWVDGSWHVLDATGMAPRPSLVRIATGRDAADIAFLSSYGAPVWLRQLEVTCVVEDRLPADDGATPVRMP